MTYTNQIWSTRYFGHGSEIHLEFSPSTQAGPRGGELRDIGSPGSPKLPCCGDVRHAEAAAGTLKDIGPGDGCGAFTVTAAPVLAGEANSCHSSGLQAEFPLPAPPLEPYDVGATRSTVLKLSLCQGNKSMTTKNHLRKQSTAGNFPSRKLLHLTQSTRSDQKRPPSEGR